MNSEKNTNEKKYQMFHVKPEYQFVEEPVYEYSKQMGLDTDFSRRSILFLEHLLDYNRKVNLVSRRDEQNIVINQWLHSLICLPLLKADQPDRVLDIGSGGGFPGILLALLFRETEFLLVESIAKKCKFLEDVSQALQLPNVVVCNERVENLSSGYRNRYDIVTVRAVTNLSQLWKWAVPLLKTNAFMLTWKKYNTPEIEDLKSSVRKQKMIRVLTPENDFGLERIKETRIIKVIKL